MRRLGLAVLVAVWVAGCAGSLHADPTPSRRYAVHDGLPSEHITALAQTSNGLLWIGTQNGLAVYDGHQFRTFSFPDSVRQRQVAALRPLPDGSVWVGVGHDALRVAPHGVLRSLWLGDHQVSEVLRRGETTLFVTDRAVWTLPPGASRPTRTRFRFRGEPHMTIMWGADLDAQGRLWIATGPQGPGRVHADGTVTYPATAADAASGAPFHDVQFVKDGTAIAVRDSTVYRLDSDARTLDPVTSASAARSIAYQGGSTAYLTGGSSVPRYDTKAHRLRSPRPISDDTTRETTAVLRGRAGGLWVGTEDGLFHVPNPAARHRRVVAGTAIRNGMGFRTHGAALWGNTWGAGLFQLRPRRRQTMPGGLSQWVLLRNPAERLHGLGTAPGVAGRWWYRWDAGEGWTRVGHVGGGIRGYVDTGGTGYFWHNDGLYRHVPAGDSTRVTELRSWPLNDSQHHLMGSAPNGDIILFDQGDVLRLRRPDGAVIDTLASVPEHASSQGRRLTVDAAGRVWCPFRGSGLLRVDPGQGTTQTLLEGTVVEAVRMAGDSLALVKATRGLYLLNARTGTTRRHLTTADGLLSNDVNGSVIVGDTLYVGHPSGVSLLPADSLLAAPPRPRAVLTGLEVNFDERSLSSDTDWTAEERTVGVSYTGASLAHADRVRYEVRLTPHDTTWNPTQRRFARYTDLGPGTYRFEVRARLAGQPPGPVATHSFTIPPHFYETGWFRLLVMLGVIGLAVGAYRWRTVRLRKRQEELRRAVDERTRDLAAEKQKTEEQAERLAELDEAKNRFFAHVSHEFRTPLSLILSPLRDALQRASDGAARLSENQLRRMAGNADRLQRLIDQLLDLATLEAGEMELDRRPGDLAAVVERAAEAFRSKAAQKEIALRVERPEERIETQFDPEKVETIMSNLVGNAVKFTPAGGAVTVRLSRTDDTERVEAPNSAAVVAGSARIAVEDTGPGIEPGVQDAIFDRFKQSRQPSGSPTRAHEGTGLGLALTSELVDLHGGTIDVDAAPGEGSTFTVRLPVVPVAGTRGEGGKVEGENVGGPEVEDWQVHGGDGTARMKGDGEIGEEGAAILVVEDKAEMRAYLREELGRRWAIREAANGKEGWETVQDEEPDLVVSDVMMPETDGFELCRRIKADEDLRTIPVLLLTARVQDEAVQEGLSCEADDYVPKPFDIAELKQRIENHLAARRHLKARYRQEVEITALGAVVDEEERPFVEEVFGIIDERLSDPDFGVGDLADAMALSRRQLTRRMKRTLDRTPGDLIQRRRLDRARDILERGPETIAEVVYAVGFRSPSHFSERFRETMGVSPSAYREQHADRP